MNKELFRSMQTQLCPSPEARDALAERLASAKKKTVPVGRYAAAAACVLVIAAAVPVYGVVRDQQKWRAILDNFHKGVILDTFQTDCAATPERPHSYELAEGTSCWPEDSAVTENSDTGSGGDQDQDMTPGELADNLLEAGFTREDVDAYLASGWQMTWGKWWKFHHQSEEAGDRTLEALLAFSQAEGLAVNTGDAPDEPLTHEDQGEAVAAYQRLMARFEADCGPDRYPEWYGGAYIDKHAGLIVNIVESYEPEGKELFFQIQDWADSEKVGFGSSRFSLNQLRELQNKVLAAMDALGLAAGCGIDEEAGRIVLTLPEVTDEALWQLARLDPSDTAIQVIVARTSAADTAAEEPVGIVPGVSHAIQPGGDEAGPGTPVSGVDGLIVDEDGVIAYEPQG